MNPENTKTPEIKHEKLEIQLYLAQSANPENINQQIKHGVALEDLTFVSMVTDESKKPTTIKLDYNQNMDLHNEIMRAQMETTMSRPVQPFLNNKNINRVRPKKYKYLVLKQNRRMGTMTCLTRLLPGDACNPTENKQYPIVGQLPEDLYSKKEILNMELEKKNKF